MGFEPTVGFPPRSVSNRVLSASQPRLRRGSFKRRSGRGQGGKPAAARSCRAAALQAPSHGHNSTARRYTRKTPPGASTRCPSGFPGDRISRRPQPPLRFQHIAASLHPFRLVGCAGHFRRNRGSNEQIVKLVGQVIDIVGPTLPRHVPIGSDAGPAGYGVDQLQPPPQSPSHALPPVPQFPPHSPNILYS